MITTTTCATVIGMRTHLVTVEVDLRKGFPGFTIVGLPDTAVQEARERIKSAIYNVGLQFPYTYRITVNLAPARIKKIGSIYDLAIAIGILLATNKKSFTVTGHDLFLGELALDGTVRYCNNLTPILLDAQKLGITNVYIPKANHADAHLIPECATYPVTNIAQLYDHCIGKKTLTPISAQSIKLFRNKTIYAKPSPDFAQIIGQHNSKRALEIAAAGAHNVLLSGPPGSGKTMLARACATILPELTSMQMKAVTRIYALAGLLNEQTPHITRRPFRAPHHSSSMSACIGGGRELTPGEISLAHHGILFLDELPEFRRDVLEALRLPLEHGAITISRAQTQATFPASFMLIASQNPCPCGFANDPDITCSCSPQQITRYQKKLSGPLADRIDMHVWVPRVPITTLRNTKPEEPSAQIRTRIQMARTLQHDRFAHESISTNSEMNSTMTKYYCALNASSERILITAAKKFHLSTRSYFRIKKMARTIADLVQSPNITQEHILEALHYRNAK